VLRPDIVSHRRPDHHWAAIFLSATERLIRGKITNMTATCPECDADVAIPADAMENELISCPDCGSELEIISLNPVQLELAPEVEEDWGE
jgi:alpha-aminoadipate carrier protein LysW